MSNTREKYSRSVWFGSALVAAGVVWLFFTVSLPIAVPLLGFGIKGQFWHQLSEEQKQGKSSMSIAGLTKFEWDTLCIFHGYGESPAKVLKARGIDVIPSPHSKRAEATEKNSDVVFFAFALKWRVVESFIENASVYMNGSGQRIRIENECVHKNTAIVRIENASRSRTLVFTEEK